MEKFEKTEKVENSNKEINDEEEYESLKPLSKRSRFETVKCEDELIHEMKEYEIENEKYRIDNNLYGDGEELDENSREWNYDDDDDDEEEDNNSENMDLENMDDDTSGDDKEYEVDYDTD
jgi:hypothetical protein